MYRGYFNNQFYDINYAFVGYNKNKKSQYISSRLIFKRLI